MDAKVPVFEVSGDSDEELFRIVAERIGADLPPECMAGAAQNARLLMRHLAVLRGESQ